MLIGVLLLVSVGALNLLVPDSAKFVEVEMTVCNGADCKTITTGPAPAPSPGVAGRAPASNRSTAP